ncbi:unnamed protein product [Camellia sinensis]
MVTFICGSRRAMTRTLSRRKKERIVRLGNKKKPIARLQSNLSSKALLMVKMISWRKVDQHEDEQEKDEDEGFDGSDEAVWRRTIMMGEKCRPLDFSGKILYDCHGNLLPRRIDLGMHSLVDIIGGHAFGLAILAFWISVHEYIDDFIVSGQNEFHLVEALRWVFPALTIPRIHTFGYLAPEYFMYGKVSDTVNVYSFGVVLLELLSGRKAITFDADKGQESLVMWAKLKLETGNLRSILDLNLEGNIDETQIQRMGLAARICLTRSARLRSKMSQVM